jgi:hypothetical protein
MRSFPASEFAPIVWVSVLLLLSKITLDPSRSECPDG